MVEIASCRQQYYVEIFRSDFTNNDVLEVLFKNKNKIMTRYLLTFIFFFIIMIYFH